MNKTNAVFSSCVVARPSALSGLARVLDLAGRFDRYNQSRTEQEADFHALANDWRVVGADLRGALSER